MGISDQFYNNKNSVCLQLMCINDLSFYLYVYQHPNLSHFWPQEYTVEFLTNSFRQSIKRNKDHAFKKVFVIVDRRSKKQIGIASIKCVNELGETGLIICPEFQKNGFGILVKGCLMDLAFHQFGVTELMAECHLKNESIIKINENLGYEFCQLSTKNHGTGVWLINKEKYQRLKSR